MNTITSTSRSTSSYKSNIGLRSQKTIRRNKNLSYSECNSVITLHNDFNQFLAAEVYLDASTSIKSHLNRNESVHVHISLTKLNASGIKGLLNVFNTLNHGRRVGNNVSVTWMTPWEDEELFDLAFDFSELYDFKVELIPC